MKAEKAIVLNRILTPAERRKVVAMTSVERFHYASAFQIPESKEYFHSETVQKRISLDSKEIINNFGDGLINGQAVSELLTLDGAHLWHYHKFRIYYALQNYLLLKSALKTLLGQYQAVDYYGTESLPDDIICNSHFSYCKGSSPRKSRLAQLAYFAHFFRRGLTGSSTGKLTAKQLLLFSERYVPMLSLKGNCIEGNPYLEYLFERLDDPFVLLTDTSMPSFAKSAPRLIKHKNYYQPSYRGIPKVHVERILLKNVFYPVWWKELKNKMTQLSDHLSLIASGMLSEEERFILRKIIDLMPSSRYFLFKNLVFRFYFSKYKISTITALDENSANYKTILDAASSYNIPTAGIQHGSIYGAHMAYAYTALDRKNCVMVDKTFIWGEHWKKILVNACNYPGEGLTICGQLRTDIIPRLNKIKVNAKRIVLYASQPQRNAQLRYRAAADVVGALGARPDLSLIIRPHPAEFNELDYFYSIARQFPASQVVIDSTTDLYQLLSTSDAVITCFSTVGAETVYFNKPLVVLDYLGLDSLGYIKSGVGLPATDKESLEKWFDVLQENNYSINHDAYRKFVAARVYRIDGECSHRILCGIRSLKTMKKN
ncbi:MAG: hypothetical protein RBR21_11260 [Bacteroidales bacterium]|nr:hypothetical protein [Bacteroidales bacterium]